MPTSRKFCLSSSTNSNPSPSQRSPSLTSTKKTWKPILRKKYSLAKYSTPKYTETSPFSIVSGQSSLSTSKAPRCSLPKKWKEAQLPTTTLHSKMALTMSNTNTLSPNSEVTSLKTPTTYTQGEWTPQKHKTIKKLDQLKQPLSSYLKLKSQNQGSFKFTLLPSSIPMKNLRESRKEKRLDLMCSTRWKRIKGKFSNLEIGRLFFQKPSKATFWILEAEFKKLLLRTSFLKTWLHREKLWWLEN